LKNTQKYDKINTGGDNMTDKKNCPLHKTSIGGQAVIEGVMMRGPESIAVAVRKPDKEIVIDKKPIGKVRRNKIFKFPIIRGVVNFFDSLIVGLQALTFSAKFFDLDENGNQIEETPSKFEQWLEKKLGSEKVMNTVIGISIIISLCLSIFLFVFLPTFLCGLVAKISDSIFLRSFTEGVVKIAIFIAYLSLCGQTKDMKRVFAYHGAEHKTINCYEHGDELTVENVKKYSRLHPRCGTSFLLIVMVISIFISFFLPVNPTWLRILLKVLCLPVVAGLSYEIIKFAGRHDNRFTRIISAPGMWFQHITTKEPDDSMIEVAIASLNAVKPENKDEAKW